MVLVLLVLAGLTIMPTLAHAATSMTSARTVERNVNGLYAAEAGVKYALGNLEPGSHQLTENINQMAVTVQVDMSDITFVLYSGELIQGGQHSNWLSVDSEIVGEATPYEYKITVTWQAEDGAQVIHLKEVGGRLPVGYSYIEGSAVVGGNLADRDPDDLFEDAGGAYMLNWDLKLETPLPFVSENNTVRTQTFQIDGEGNLDGYYAWVVAGVTGEVSEITGILYTITATAICPEDSETTGKIVCTVLKQQDGTKNIISWEVLK